ncbi:hypothetical protein AADZ86_18505 [Colwelliaceae bacterium BS250]
MKTITIAAISTVLLTQVGCAFMEPDPCEKIVFSSEQQSECSNLQRQIVNAKNEPIKRTELQRRYELDCVDLRYYRDDMTLERCENKENKENVDQLIKNEEAENAEMAKEAEQGLETKDVVELQQDTETSTKESTEKS